MNWQAGQLGLNSGAAVVNNGVWDIQTDSGIGQSGGGGSSFTNQGVLRKSAGSGTSTLGSSLLGLANPGVMDVQTGTIALPNGFVNTGRMMGDGQFSSASSGLANQGTLAPGSFGAGTLALQCLGDCSFAVGDSLTILDASGSLTGTFSSITLSGFATGAFEVVYDLGTSSVRLLVTESVTAVPEPGSWAMLAAGLALVASVARRRRI